ncbi:hypothetical protein C8R46DRAFT_1149767 [Mycena filopes]|nr:hypothetical protein C8R46DRAFT_1149767 [Mycena filopes]
MARGRRKPAQPSSKSNWPKCRWCKQRRDGRGIEKHQALCRADHEFLRHKSRRRPAANLNTHTTSEGSDPASRHQSPEPMDLDPPDGGDPGVDPNDDFVGPRLPGEYFKIIPHPHSTDTTPIIIPLDGSAKSATETSFSSELPHDTPWFPFRSRADFEVTEIATTGGLNPELTNKLLNGATNEWGTGKSRLTIRTSEDMRATLASARKYGVTFKPASVFAKYKGVTQEIKFEYRDPWDWITNLLDDATLSSTAMYNSVRKFYCEGSIDVVHEERVIDEPNTADTWAEYESELPEPDPYPHCFLPLHWWLDEGLVTKRITMHPMVMRAVIQPGNIRNASGNGGGVLVGYMTAVRDPADPSNRNTPQTLEFARYKMEIYQKVLKIIFASLKSRSWSGEPIRCPDGLVRVFHPGILINSLDGKEAAYFNACRAALAKFPCPKCLVEKCDLHKITTTFTLRTSATMKAAVIKALKQETKTDTERILKSFGLHGVHHCLWDFRFCDPYTAYSYDTLHSDDLGKWGHHLWTLLLQILEERGGKSSLAEYMRRFPRWANLKHFNHVTTVHFTDGQSFYDILKCILPCIVQLFGANDPLVHCIRAYQRTRIMTGMHCMPESRLKRLIVFIQDYEYWCERVSAVYNKDFSFFKQHALSHVVRDIRGKGTTNHGSTRPGEGFQQEAREAYARTNKKDAAHQMVRVDETQEAIARIRMHLNNYDRAQRKSQDLDEDVDETPVDTHDGAHWAFGAPVPGRLLNSRALEENHPHSAAFQNFDFRLRLFIAETFPEEHIKLEDTIMIRSFKCVHISYRSLEDWRGAQDIMRCNSSFHGEARFDCLLVNFTDPGLHFARLRSLLRCHLPSGRRVDIALIRMFEKSRWKPRTLWAGCQIRDEAKEYSFLSMEHVIRGALLTPVSGASMEPTHIFIDTVDADMFLRADQ